MYVARSANIEESKQLLMKLWADNLPVDGGLEEKLRWFYCDGPHGAGRAFVLNTGGETVGCAGVGVRRMQHHGRELKAALFADLAVDRAHRSGLPAVVLLRQVRSDIAREFDVGYGFPTNKAIAVYRRAGYAELGSMFRYVRVLRSEQYLRPKLGRWVTPPAAMIADLALAAVAHAHRLRSRGFSVVWPEAFDERFDAMWERRGREYAVQCERTSEFLRWRFERDRYRIMALARGNGELAAYAVLRSRTTDDDPVVDIMDLFGAGERELDAMLASLIPAVRAMGPSSIGFRFLGNRGVVRLLAQHGFAKRSEPRAVVVTGELRDLDSWYLTDLDEDT
ncbi:MAG: GNAT family N-acetyltransferase [Deltaproteobacteria bacterium]|nr:GNAT family N-acetyltransferase [Deltaproteobacteria bacterium]